MSDPTRQLDGRAADVILLFRYATLAEPCQIRRDNLTDALLLYQFHRDVQDEVMWIETKLPVASSQELGSSLPEVLNLQKKHQVSQWCDIRHVAGSVHVCGL